MSTRNITLDNETVRIASGPQNVTIFCRGSASYYIEDGTSPPAPGSGIAGIPLDKESMYLDENEDLFVRGNGLITVISKTQAF